MGQGATMSTEERQSSKTPSLNHSVRRPLWNSIANDSHRREEGRHLCIQQPFTMLVLLVDALQQWDQLLCEKQC